MIEQPIEPDTIEPDKERSVLVVEGVGDPETLFRPDALTRFREYLREILGDSE